jgi:hypothetical protein
LWSPLYPVQMYRSNPIFMLPYLKAVVNPKYSVQASILLPVDHPVHESSWTTGPATKSNQYSANIGSLIAHWQTIAFWNHGLDLHVDNISWDCDIISYATFNSTEENMQVYSLIPKPGLALKAPKGTCIHTKGPTDSCVCTA